MDPHVDLETINNAIAGDEHACQKILNQYKGRIFSFVYRTVRNYDDAEEIAFETFIRCFKSLQKYDQSRPFTTWLFTIAHNLMIDFLRRNKIEYEYFEEMHPVQNGLAEKYEKDKKMKQIEDAIGKLAPLDREIVILFHREEHSYEDICEILNLPLSTIKTRLHRARNKLRELVHSQKPLVIDSVPRNAGKKKP